MGLSRNKVAVSEGAAGSPPFYGERVMIQTESLRKFKRFKRRRRTVLVSKVVQFSVIKGLLKKLVLQTQRVHLFPFRTQKLSSAVAKILGWKRPGKIAQCQHNRGVEQSTPTIGNSKFGIPNSKLQLPSERDHLTNHIGS